MNTFMKIVGVAGVALLAYGAYRVMTGGSARRVIQNNQYAPTANFGDWPATRWSADEANFVGPQEQLQDEEVKEFDVYDVSNIQM